ncbi:MAG: hypothetical protein FWG63_12215 [Defluviitaleaceae bacterium]|nr:hypothetical protein [Defluviitaleaceae bacterium]
MAVVVIIVNFHKKLALTAIKITTLIIQSVRTVIISTRPHPKAAGSRQETTQNKTRNCRLMKFTSRSYETMRKHLVFLSAM